MFQKLALLYCINAFYKTFGAELEMPNCRATLRDLDNRDCLLETQFHIFEILEAYDNCFSKLTYNKLTKLNNKINNILF